MALSTTDDENLAAILDAFQPAALSTQLLLSEPHSGERFVSVRPIGRFFPKVPDTKFKKSVILRLKAADPRLYSVDQVVETTGIYAPILGGFDYAVNYPKEYVGAGTSNELPLENLGSSPAYPLIRIFGPQDAGTMTAATVTNMTTGQEAVFVFTASLLASDVFSAYMQRIVTNDSAEDPYIALGGSNRWGNWQLPREPFYLAPKSVNVIRFEVTGTTTDAECLLSYRHTSL